MYGTLAAESGPRGEEAGGRVDLDTFSGTRDDVRGPVTCLRVAASRAAMVVDNEAGADMLIYVVPVEQCAVPGSRAVQPVRVS